MLTAHPFVFSARRVQAFALAVQSGRADVESLPPKPGKRRLVPAIDEMFTQDCVFYEPNGVHRGRDEIHRVAGAIKATHPDFRYQPIAGPEELGNGGRIQWVSGRPGQAPAYAGTDFIISQDGRIAAVYLFFDKLR